MLRRHGVLRGTDFALRLPSVGATLTLMLAACCAAGVTTLRGAACEPEIADTAAFLNACGAKITGAGTPVVCIRGTGGELLDGCVHTVLPDRIAAATYAAAAAIAGGRGTVTQCSPVWLAAFLDFLQGSGCEVARGENEFSITRDQDTKLRGGQELVAAAYPGLATDTAPLAAAVLLGAEGASRIYDGLFQNRFACAQGFAALGADARSEGRLLYLGGSAKLHGATVTAYSLPRRLCHPGTYSLIIFHMLSRPSSSVKEKHDLSSLNLIFFQTRCFIREKYPDRNFIISVIYLVIDCFVKDFHWVYRFEAGKMSGCLHLNPVKRQCL